MATAKKIFKEISQIIVQSRITPSALDGIQDKDYGELQLHEWETVNVAVDRRHSAPETGSWRGMTVEIKLRLNADAEPETVEQWYFGLSGQPKLSRKDVNAMYKALYTHLRVLPLFWLKSKSLPPLEFSYEVFSGPPQRPLSASPSEVVEFGDGRNGFKLVYYHLGDVAEMVHAKRSGRPNHGQRSDVQPPVASSPSSFGAAGPSSFSSNVPQSLPMQGDHDRRERGSDDGLNRRRGGSGGGGGGGYGSPDHPVDYQRDRSGSLDYQRDRSGSLNAGSMDYLRGDPTAAGSLGASPSDVRYSYSKPPDPTGRGRYHQPSPSADDCQRERASSMGATGLPEYRPLHGSSSTAGPGPVRYVRDPPLEPSFGATPQRSAPMDIPSRRPADPRTRPEYRSTAPARTRNEYHRAAPGSSSNSSRGWHGDNHRVEPQQQNPMVGRRAQHVLDNEADERFRARTGSLPSRLRPKLSGGDKVGDRDRTGPPQLQHDLNDADYGFPFASTSYGSPASYGSPSSLSNRSPSDRQGFPGTSQRTPQSYGSAGSSNLKISYLHVGSSPSVTSLSASRLSLRSNDDGSLGSGPDLDDEIGLMEEHRHDTHEELPFAMDDGDELESFVEQFKQAPMSLSMFSSRLDVVESIAHLEDDLNASRSELAMFNDSVARK